MPEKKGRIAAAELIAGECLAVRVRTLNRAVSGLYDEALRPHGLRVGQLNLLVVVARMGTARPADLCRILRMDKSTLSRDVEVIRRNGWLEVEDSTDARARPLRLSAPGHALIETVLPAWRQAQEKAKALIGREATVALGQAVDRIWKGGTLAADPATRLKSVSRKRAEPENGDWLRSYPAGACPHFQAERPREGGTGTGRVQPEPVPVPEASPFSTPSKSYCCNDNRIARSPVRGADRRRNGRRKARLILITRRQEVRPMIRGVESDDAEGRLERAVR